MEWALDILKPEAAHFWATHQGADLDLFVIRKGRRYGIEVKREDAPRVTPSMRTALSDLGLSHLTVLYPGRERYALAPRITVVPMAWLARHDPRVLTGASGRPAPGEGP